MTEADERSAYEIRRYSSSTLVLLRFLALALIGSLAACVHNRAIDRWLMCDECMEGELDSVVALESGAVERLTNTLGGPPPDRAENMRRRFSASY